MNRKECIYMAKEFHPDTVDDLIHDAQNILSWLNDEFVIDTDTGYVDHELDKPIEDPSELYHLIKLFHEEGIETRPSDLVEAGASEFHLYRAFPLLEEHGLIERVRKNGHETIIKLKRIA